MKQSLRNIITGASLFGLTILTAVGGYMMAGWQPLDALYMTVITVFGVGYGETQPVSTPQLRVFTMLVIVAGAISVAYAVGGFVQFVAEGEIRRALGVRRMMREIDSLQQHVIICGVGRIGRTLAVKLTEARQPFMVIDSEPSRVARAEAMGWLVLAGDATDETVLEAAGIGRAKVLATTLPDDAANVFITLTARGLNPDLTIVARGELPSTEKKLRQAGADHVVLPATIGALRMAHLISHPAALDFMDQNDGRRTLNEQLALIDVQLDELVIDEASPLVGETIGDLESRSRGTFIVVALRGADGSNTVHPDQTQILSVGDTVIVMGHRADIPKFAQSYALKRQLRYRGAGH